MSYEVYAQPVIRCQLSIESSPPVAPIDINTGLPPAFWRAGGVEIDVGVFNGGDVGLDLSNFDYLQLALLPSPTSLVPWLVKALLSEDVVSPIDFGSWLNGSAQNAAFVLTPADTDLGLGAQASRQFWMTLAGYTGDSVAIFGAGYVTLYNPGVGYPPPVGGVTSWHEQANSSGNFTIAPQGAIHTEEVTFTGSAGTRNVVLAAAGFAPGSIVRLLALLPNLTPGIVINVYSNTLSGDPILTYTTDAYQPNAKLEAVVNGSLGYDAYEIVSPAFL